MLLLEWKNHYFVVVVVKTRSGKNCQCILVQAPSWISALSCWRGLCNDEAMSHAVYGHPRQRGHSGEFWQNVIHWRRKWQTTSVYLPWEPHELYKRTKKLLYLKMSPPDLKMPNMLLGKNRGELLIATESMKRLGQSGNDAQLWMCLVMKVKSDSSKNSIA